ncbi:MAG: hypothetical protein KAJ19_14355 [Gammaproteobacteria bacterium]|nr:hypothetical protein [Gammaproteobacteria bacterium]
MGCNFYYGDPKIHIGKRSAAGLYCWDCGITLCKSGERIIHSGQAQWHESCPNCGQRPIKEGLDNSSAGRELGFNKGPFIKKTGVRSCSSFSWDIHLDGLRNASLIVDEYGHEYSKRLFYSVLKECPIQFFDSIGMNFS